jgi:hypothetical protein
MAKTNRPSVQKHEREQKKRERQRKKADKAALKRERRRDPTPAAGNADHPSP